MKITYNSKIKYVRVKDFQQQFSLSKAQAYKLLSLPEMKKAIIYTGERSMRVNIDLAFEIMQALFNYELR